MLSPEFRWEEVDTVLLDMDGTLLDRHFDDHFWLEHAPMRWASLNRQPIETAKKHLYALFRSQERTLNWTDLDYWSDRLGMDIPLLKLEVEHLIKIHPGFIEFLTFLRHHNKHVWLVTNAHSKTLDIKLKKTRIGQYFDGIVSAHDVGTPKEDVNFWERLQGFVEYDPARTMLGEDTEDNLHTAATYGIKYLVYISRASSSLPRKDSKQFFSVDYFTRLIPHIG